MFGLVEDACYTFDDGDDYKVIFGKRLNRTFDWVSDAPTVERCIVGCIAIEPVQRMLHSLLKYDAKREASVSVWATRQGARQQFGK